MQCDIQSVVKGRINCRLPVNKGSSSEIHEVLPKVFTLYSTQNPGYRFCHTIKIYFAPSLGMPLEAMFVQEYLLKLDKVFKIYFYGISVVKIWPNWKLIFRA